MESMANHIQKLRQERVARENARIEKLRDLNLKKYSKTETLNNKPQKAGNSSSVTQIKSSIPDPYVTVRRPKTAPTQSTEVSAKPSDGPKREGKVNFLQRNIKALKNVKGTKNHSKSDKTYIKPAIQPHGSKLVASSSKPTTERLINRKTIPKPDPPKKSVFKSLHEPKKPHGEVENSSIQSNNLSKITDSILANATFTETEAIIAPFRRSVSAVYLKQEACNVPENCTPKWKSIGDKLNHPDLALEDDDDIAVSSVVRSECKKVMFKLSPSHELQRNLKAWLQENGKSVDSYHHLQCFALHLQPSRFSTPKQFEPYCEKNKENVSPVFDTKSISIIEIMDDTQDDAHYSRSKEKNVDVYSWRQHNSSYDSINTDTEDIMILNDQTLPNIEELLDLALKDLTELLKTGYDCDQSASFLKAMKCLYPHAPRTAAYWQCRAALEERRGNLHSAIQSWEEAIVTGVEKSVVEANLEVLLTNFMELKISANLDDQRLRGNMTEVKNVCKSTIIRYIVKQAKFRQSIKPIATITPVRRRDAESQ